MSKAAIEKTLAASRQLEAATQYARGLRKGSDVAYWHERDAQVGQG